jgi:hypothetical protein
MRHRIQVGFHAFLDGGDEEFGAIRAVSPRDQQLTVYVENSGEFTVPIEAVVSVQEEKAIFDPERLEARLLDAIRHAHDAEQF